MKKFSSVFLLFLFSLLLGFTSVASAKSIFPNPLINAEWLVEHIDEVLILDTRKDLDSFNKVGHIENAIPVDITKIRMEREIDGKKITRMRPDPKTFETFMREHGINNDTQIVITHEGKTPGQVAGAARLYWQMKFYGVESVALLDGGNVAWVEGLEDLSTDSTEFEAGDFTVDAENLDVLATMQQVKASLKDDSTTLIDTRGLRYHVGVDKKDYVFAFGHIAGAKVLPYKFFHPIKGSTAYYSADKLKRIVKDLNIDMDNKLIMFCNSAYECASDWFVFHEILGKKDVRVYDGSLHQWTQYKDNPMSRGLGQ